MDQPDALYVRDGELFVPTGLARTGWEEDAQHGGPPAGLLAHALESMPFDIPMQPARMTFDLIRRVPLEPMTVTTEAVRTGRRIRVLRAALSVGGVEVARAGSLWIRTTQLDLPELELPDHEPLPGPAETPHISEFNWERGDPELSRFHRDSVETRSVGDSFWASGRGRSWVRLKYPLVAGVPLTPLTRAATLADVANGNARLLDPNDWMFINPDTTVHLHRELEGEWLGMDSVAHQHPHGIGMADTVLMDRRGSIGRVLQSQIILRR